MMLRNTIKPESALGLGGVTPAIGGGAEHAIDNVSVPQSSSHSSAWFKVDGLQRIRFVKGAATGADVTFKIEGTPDVGTTFYTIAAAVADGALVDLAEAQIRVTANNASAVTAETADCWLTS